MKFFSSPILSYFGLFLGVVTLLLGRASDRLTKESLSWEPTTCLITQSEVESGLRTNGKGHYYTPIIDCEFSIDSEAYSLNFISMSKSTQGESASNDFVDRYPLGANATIYYDPDNPYWNTFEPGGAQSAGYVFAYLILIFAFITNPTIGRIINKFRKKKDSKTEEC